MVSGKIIFKGLIELLSPALIGSGKNDNSDTDILLDSSDRPFIPATSFIGVLKNYIKLDEKYKKELEDFWGFTRGKKGKQSSIKCSDLKCSGKFSIIIRDGIKINNKTGIVKDKGKYDYELVERGAKFEVYIEADYTKDTENFVETMMATICSLLESRDFYIGAKTNNGFGKIKLLEKKIHVFDFSKSEHVILWLNREMPEIASLPEPFKIKNKIFSINAIFDLKSSLIIRSYPADPRMPDAVNIKSKDENVITGSSLKGAIRARGERIFNTLNKDESLFMKLFGNVDEDNRSDKAVKGKVKVEEVILPKFISELNNRIKIDRFTGGTIESALFDTMPVYTDFNEKVKNVKITVKDYEDYEAGLLLLVLKDLWTGDIAIGGEKNIGRGVLQGCEAIIKWDKDEIKLEKDFSKLSQDEKNKLEKFVKELVSY